MRRRISLLGAITLLAGALVVPAPVAAATYGKYTIIQNYCYGNGNIYFKVKLTKYAGAYSTDLSFSGKGQGYVNGWRNEYNYGTVYGDAVGYGKYNWTRWFEFVPGHSGDHRINLTLRIWDGNQILATARVHSRTC